MIGVPSIDKEHQELIAKLDAVLNSRSAQPDSEEFF